MRIYILRGFKDDNQKSPKTTKKILRYIKCKLKIMVQISIM